MLKAMKKELNMSIILSIVYVILGVIIISRPETVITVIGKVVAILGIIYGIVITIMNISDLEEENTLLRGILAIVMGIALLIYPNSLSILISLGIGILFISSSVARIRFSVFLRKVPEVNWIIILVSSIITLLIGISFVFAPLASAVTLATVSGILMIVYSVIDIFEIILLKIKMKAIEKVL